MKIIKRNGTEVDFDIQKIIDAITKASNKCKEDYLSTEEISNIAKEVMIKCENSLHTVSVEEVSDMVEIMLMHSNHYFIAKEYITYRYKRNIVRQSNTTDDSILSIIELNNEEIKQENSNKNPVINSTQRDYMAGEVSKDLTERILLPQDIVKAHKEGIIHFHDSDYFAQHMHNCCLVNLEDILQIGTVISDTLIEKPHSFAVACNIATQCVAQVASNQYGGQTISLSHLAPFVDVSRKRLIKDVIEELTSSGIFPDDKLIKNIVEKRLRKEVINGVQTIQYQLVTLMTTNGQTPFVSIFMYLNEVEDGQTKDDLAMIIEEMLKQRIIGTKNENGVYITPTFPKLLYVLQEDNIKPDGKYWYLTELAAKCSTKRLVPDYISEKKMKEMKNGDVYGCINKTCA